MCGIFGYIGTKTNAPEMIFKGLQTLEYRGYDSWGIAILNSNQKLQRQRQTGKIDKKQLKLSGGTIGIGHTRWATHGGVFEKNAHPHLDCNEEIAVLHNGIIENYQELKEELLKKGHHFTSDTDTEVVPHLLEEYVKHSPIKNAVKKTFQRLRGLSALVILYQRTKEIFVVKNGSPIVIGKGQDEYFIASDAVGILPYTNTLLFLNDHELAILGENSLVLEHIDTDKHIKEYFETVSWQQSHVTKGNYKHFMLKEIAEQPQVIRTIAKTQKELIEKQAPRIEHAFGTFFIGSGTASYACLAGTYLFSKIAHIHVNMAPASEFMYLEDFLTPDSLIIPLSQSGETIDIVEPLTRAKKKGSKILAIVNTLGSTIYRLADQTILLQAGPEKAVASTKAYTAKIAVLTYLAYAIAKDSQTGQKKLLESAQEIQRLLKPNTTKTLRSIAKKIARHEHVYLIGRGMSYATALEGALKIKEVSYIHAEGLAGGEIKHGPIALIDKGTPCIVIAPQDETHAAILSNAMELKSRGGYIIGISPKNSPIFDEWIQVKDTGIPLITQVIPLQLLGYFLSLQRGVADPDKPRNLAKSVTVK